MFYKAVLFDCDGTLVDSQMLYNLAVSEILTKLDPKYDLDYCSKLFDGKCWNSQLLNIAESAELAQDLAQKAAGVALGLIREFVRSNAGVEKFLLKLKLLHVPFAICSNAPADAVGLALDHSGLSTFFDPMRIFSRDLVARPKPDPEIYLMAASALDVDPSSCLVVEDSVSGAEAGARAGMDVAVYFGGSHVRHIGVGNLFQAVRGKVGDRLVKYTDDFAEIFSIMDDDQSAVV